MEISGYAHYTVLLSLLLKWNLWLRSQHRFTSLLLKCDIWLRSLRYFYSLLLRWNIWLGSLHCFTWLLLTLDIALPSLLLLSLIHQRVFPQEFQCFHKICICQSSFTDRKFSGVLHDLLPVIKNNLLINCGRHTN